MFCLLDLLSLPKLSSAKMPQPQSNVGHIHNRVQIENRTPSMYIDSRRHCCCTTVKRCQSEFIKRKTMCKSAKPGFVLQDLFSPFGFVVPPKISPHMISGNVYVRKSKQCGKSWEFVRKRESCDRKMCQGCRTHAARAKRISIVEQQDAALSSRIRELENELRATEQQEMNHRIGVRESRPYHRSNTHQQSSHVNVCEEVREAARPRERSRHRERPSACQKKTKRIEIDESLQEVIGSSRSRHNECYGEPRCCSYKRQTIDPCCSYARKRSRCAHAYPTLSYEDIEPPVTHELVQEIIIPRTRQACRVSKYCGVMYENRHPDDYLNGACRL